MQFRVVILISLFIITSYGCSRDNNTVLLDKDGLTAQQALGKRLFFDTRLSEPEGQACSSCHNPEAAFSLPQQTPHMPVSAGAHTQRFGNRNTPTIQYAAYIPALTYDKTEEVYVGGLFLDGRKNSLEFQASGPVLNPVEMAVPTPQVLRHKLLSAGYEKDFQKFFGDNALVNNENTISQFSLVLAAYQRSKELNPFSSKYDAYLNGNVKLTEQELRGLELYEAEDKGNCAACHPSEVGENKQPPLFTDFTYDNLGVPANPKNPFYTQSKRFNPDGKDYIDLGLGSVLNEDAQNGKFRVPTLRNIAKTAPFMHNGVFETLEDVMDFYNTRDTKKWPKPEVELNKNTDELGDLKLTEQEIEDIIVFLNTLTDGYVVK